jgi:hypothetical protein
LTRIILSIRIEGVRDMAQQPRILPNCFKHNGKLFIYNKENNSWICDDKHSFSAGHGKYFVRWGEKLFEGRLLVKVLNRAEEWERNGQVREGD